MVLFKFVVCGLWAVREGGINLSEGEAERKTQSFIELERMVIKCKASKFAVLIKIRDKL